MNESAKKAFYITTTLPYVNSKPHMGHALEFVRADAIARYKRLMGFDVCFNTGTDEHGIKIFQKAQEEGVDTQEFVDKNAETFKNLLKSLNISNDKFIRTTDEYHKLAAQEFWKRCFDNGFIYKKTYTGLYCAGCEMFIKEKDLKNGECEIHTGKKLEEIEEENYFFKFSQFGEKLKEYYKENPDFVTPSYRLNELTKMIDEGLEDFSISRLKEKLPWGVKVPNDDEQIMYVWFDALVDYISTLGWPVDSEGQFKKYWEDGETVQICGKDNTQHQALRWQAMLLAAGLPLTNRIIVNGFINSKGQKMSKSLGNVIDPVELVEKYGTDALRYYVLRELSPHEDSDFSIEKFHEAYTANLVNGVGNLVNRILKLAEDYLDKAVDIESKKVFFSQYSDPFDNLDYKKAIDGTWEGVKWVDERIQREEPFKVVKADLEKGKQMIRELVGNLAEVAWHLQPFLPKTAEAIFDAIAKNKKPETPLFPRID
ncbi:methionine--tRNA ligase [Candidatus Nomurabacteria bacterium]|nr:methionine--tRNA ligase [Candidatus Nomurabacteria bacterium]